MIEVGLEKTLLSGKKIRYKYSDVEYDQEGWAKIPNFYPLKFDLVKGRDLSGKIIVVWWNGIGWDGLRLPKKSKITNWKRIFCDPKST